MDPLTKGRKRDALRTKLLVGFTPLIFRPRLIHEHFKTLPLIENLGHNFNT